MAKIDVSEARKVGFLRWETDVEYKNTTYTLIGATRRRANKQAKKFKAELEAQERMQQRANYNNAAE